MWRYIAQRLNGDGSPGDFLDFDLPLTQPKITDTVSGHNSLTGTISPQFARLMAEDGGLLLSEWGTAIWAENEGSIRGGGILNHSTQKGSEWSLECVGYTGYLVDLPYTDSTFYVETDPIDIYRHIWEHVQSKPGGNLGFEIADTLSGTKIGTELTQVEFDTQSGPVSFEAGPYKLAWYQTFDLSDDQNKLAQGTPFDWHERHFWDGDRIRHVLDIGYPKIGRRRDDLRFVIGENVSVIPDVDRPGEDYATEVMSLGSGEGAKMIRGSASRPPTGLRRVAVVQDSSLTSVKAANSRADAEMAWRSNLDEISSVTMRQHPHAPIGSVDPGDEIYLQGRGGWHTFGDWVKVTGVNISPEEGDVVQLDVVRTDKIAS